MLYLVDLVPTAKHSAGIDRTTRIHIHLLITNNDAPLKAVIVGCCLHLWLLLITDMLSVLSETQYVHCGT